LGLPVIAWVSGEHEYENKTPAGHLQNMSLPLARPSMGKPTARCAALDSLGRGKELAIMTSRQNTVQDDPPSGSGAPRVDPHETRKRQKFKRSVDASDPESPSMEETNAKEKARQQ